MANPLKAAAGITAGFVGGGFGFYYYLQQRHLECINLGKAMIKAEKDYSEVFLKWHHRTHSASELVKLWDEAESNQRKYNQEYDNRCLGVWAKAFNHIPKNK